MRGIGVQITDDGPVLFEVARPGPCTDATEREPWERERYAEEPRELAFGAGASHSMTDHRGGETNQGGNDPTWPSRTSATLGLRVMPETARDGAIGEQVIEEAARRLAEAAGARSRVILFGSHARDAADARSDLDFLVIEPEVADRHREMVRLRDALGGLLVPADVLVFSEREVEEWREVPNTVIHTALRDGRVLRG
jgi:uncharacterized protein